MQQVFKVSKIGTIAGCKVKDGTLKKEHSLRIIRGGIVIHQGTIDQLKHFKEVVKEVKKGSECGLSIKSYDDIQVGDQIESFTIQEVKK